MKLTTIVLLLCASGLSFADNDKWTIFGVNKKAEIIEKCTALWSAHAEAQGMILYCINGEIDAIAEMKALLNS